MLNSNTLENEDSLVPSASFENWLSSSQLGGGLLDTIIIDLSGRGNIRCGKTNIMDDTPSHVFKRIHHSDDEEEEIKLNIGKAFELLNVNNLENIPPLLIIDSPLDHVEDLKKREMICKVLFKTYKVENLSIQDGAYVSLVATGVEFMSGIVIHVGSSSTFVVAIVDGQVRVDSLCVGSISGGDLTEQLKSSLQQHFENRFDTSIFTNDIVNRLKIKYCDALFENFPLFENYTVTDSVTINIGECKEEFKKVSNLLFTNNESTTSIQELVVNCISKINDDSIDITNNIILTGGSTMMNGFSERLTTELSSTLDEITLNEQSLRSSNRTAIKFMGGNILTSVPEWITPYCVTREDYNENGPSCIVEKRSWDVMYSSPFGTDEQFGF